MLSELNRRTFFAAAAAAMRNILIDNARRKLTRKRGGGAANADARRQPATAEANRCQHRILPHEGRRSRNRRADHPGDQSCEKGHVSPSAWIVNVLRAAKTQRAISVDIDVSSFPFLDPPGCVRRPGVSRMTGWI